MSGISRVRTLAAAGLIFACLCAPFGFAGVTAARPANAARVVRYHGVSVRVPRSWPVLDLAHDPHACVRFDRHALYLGTPGREERCPAHAIGRTDAILIAPLHASLGAPIATAAGLGLERDASSYSLRRAGVEVTATWSRSPQMVSRALRRTSLQRTNAPAASTSAAAGVSAGAGSRPARSSHASTFTGRGFDTCTTPSASQMSAWHSSPYRGVAVYIGGVNMACAQPSVTRAWVAHEIASGWHLAPQYVGLQAPFNKCGCQGVSTNTRTAQAEGIAAANDAVAHVRRLGILPGNPIYYDMEGYADGGANTSGVLAFFSGWTSRLHSDGYLSGVYGSVLSTQHDLVTKYHTGYREPNDIWMANWNYRRTTHDPHIPAGEWSHHQRLHQYAGGHNESYGGVTLNIDDDFFNGATANARNGYMLLTSNGGIHLFGPIVGHGSDAGKLRRGVTAVALSRDDNTGGYWILRSDAGVTGFHAPVHGSPIHHLSGARPVALAGSPTGGYLVLSSDGRVRGFGPIGRYGGDPGKLPAGVTAVGLARDRKTGGYWILRSDGGVDSFHAPWYGGLRKKLGSAEVVALAAGQGGGYFILTSDGAVHRYGPAKLHGSDAGKLPSGVSAVSIATSPTTSGYRILRSNGRVDCFGATWYGSLVRKSSGGSPPIMIANATG